MLLRGFKTTPWLLLIPVAAWAIRKGDLSLVQLALALGLAPFALRARWRWRPTALLLIPPLLVTGSLLHAGWTYATGTARLDYSANPSRPQEGDLGQQTHLLWRGHAWRPRQFLLLTQDVSNAALVWLTDTFGQMKSAYNGPYPTREEATTFLTLKGEWVQLNDLRDAHLRLGRRELDVPPSVAREILEDTASSGGAWEALGDGRLLDFVAEEIDEISADAEEGERREDAWAAILDDRLLVLHVELHPYRNEWEPSTFGYKANKATFLVDLKGRTLVAHYWTGGTAY